MSKRKLSPVTRLLLVAKQLHAAEQTPYFENYDEEYDDDGSIHPSLNRPNFTSKVKEQVVTKEIGSLFRHIALSLHDISGTEGVNPGLSKMLGGISKDFDFDRSTISKMDQGLHYLLRSISGRSDMAFELMQKTKSPREFNLLKRLRSFLDTTSGSLNQIIEIVKRVANQGNSKSDYLHWNPKTREFLSSHVKNIVQSAESLVTKKGSQ